MVAPSSSGTAPSIWQNRGFLQLWLAQVISKAGSYVTNLALPLTAVLALGATPTQMGLLAAAGSLPNLLFSLIAGVWVDRTRRRPILVWTELGRAVLLGSVSLAAVLGSVTFAHLYVVAFVAGTLGVFFTIASVAVLPAVVPKDQLVAANSAVAMSDLVLQIAGPGAAGGLIQLVSAPKAIVVDALSYLVSAGTLGRVRIVEQPPTRAARRSIWTEIGAGLHELMRTPLLRALTLSGVVGAFGLSMQGAVWMLFVVRELGLGPAALGLLGTIGGIAAMGGAILAARTSHGLGIGPAVILGQALWTIGAVLPALAGLAGGAWAPLIAGTIATSVGATIFSVNQMSMRQQLSDVGLLGRVTAARRFLVLGAAPLGATLGGVLGSLVGLRLTLLVGAIGPLLALLVVFYSPVRATQVVADGDPSA